MRARKPPKPRRFLLSALFLILAATLFFALKPLPGFGEFHLPGGLHRFLAEHDFLENVGAFLLVSFCAFRCSPAQSWRKWIIAGLILLPVALEGLQFFLPARVPDFRDVLAGWMGISVGWLVTMLAPWRRKLSPRGGERRGLLRRHPPKMTHESDSRCSASESRPSIHDHDPGY